MYQLSVATLVPRTKHLQIQPFQTATVVPGAVGQMNFDVNLCLVLSMKLDYCRLAGFVSVSLGWCQG